MDVTGGTSKPLARLAEKTTESGAGLGSSERWGKSIERNIFLGPAGELISRQQQQQQRIQIFTPPEQQHRKRTADDDRREGKGSCSSGSSNGSIAVQHNKKSRKVSSRTLHAACQNETAEAVCTLLDLGADPRERTIFGETPLHCVATDEVAAVMLQAGADINARDRQGRTPLHSAIIYDRDGTARMLVGDGADLGARDNYGKSPLDYACQYQNAEIVKYILGSGRVNVAGSADNATGLTPLHWAEGKAVVDLLVDAGASVHARDVKGRTPLHFMFDRSNITVCALLNRGADVNAVDHKGQTPLHCLQRDADDPSLVKFVMGKGADIGARNMYGKTPLHLAAQGGFSVLTQTLLELGEDPGCKSNKGLTPLTFAAGAGHLHVVQMIIRQGPDIVNTVDMLQQTPLHYAAHKGYVAVSEALLRAGIDPNHRNTKRVSALDIAVLYGHLNVVNLFIQHGVSVTETDTLGRTPLHRAARMACTAVIASSITAALIHAGADPGSRDASGMSPLDLAARNGQKDVVNTMIREGADVQSDDDMGWSPLHHAAHRGHILVAEALVNAGADPAKRSLGDASALDVAVASGKVGVLEMMIERGVHVTDVDNNGFTALHLADRRDVVDVLIGAGADVDAQNHDGNTPLMYHSVDPELVEALLGHGAQVNIRNEKGETVVHSVLGGVRGVTLVHVLNMLLEAGADETITDKEGRKPEENLHVEEEGEDIIAARRMLDRAPRNRRWGRRRMLIMSVAGYSSASSSSHLATWLCKTRNSTEGIFRKIVGYI